MTSCVIFVAGLRDCRDVELSVSRPRLLNPPFSYRSSFFASRYKSVSLALAWMLADFTISFNTSISASFSLTLFFKSFSVA